MRTLAIFGITGHMGQSLLRALKEDPTWQLTGAIASAGSRGVGRDAGAPRDALGVAITADADAGVRGAAVAVDFSLAGSVAEHAGACAAAGVPLVVGTTGLDAAGRAALQQASLRIPVLVAANTSVGVGVMAKLVSLAAAALGSGFDVEIADAHHRLKRDAPSGTALALGDRIAAARGVELASVATYDRSGEGAPRRAGSIGFSAIRAGDIVGEHTVTFAAAGEIVEITHRATDRIIFARGALRAAAWLVGRPAGMYGMEEVLGL